MIFLAPSSTSGPASVWSLSPSSVPVPNFLFGWLINASVLLDFSMYDDDDVGLIDASVLLCI